MAYDLKIFTDNIEPLATNQIYNLLSQPPFMNSKVRIMPDVHVGSGCVVGFTAVMDGKFTGHTKIIGFCFIYLKNIFFYPIPAEHFSGNI